jgi:hypothetical protein
VYDANRRHDFIRAVYLGYKNPSDFEKNFILAKAA